MGSLPKNLVQCRTQNQALQYLSKHNSDAVRSFINTPIISSDNQTNNQTNNQTILHIASHRGFSKLVNALIETCGANVNSQTSDGTTPLISAILADRPEVVDTLLRHGADMNMTNNRHESPLHIACSTGSPKMVAMLLAQPNIRINAPDSGGDTPLLIACVGNSSKVVELLLADPNIQVNQANTNGITPLIYSCRAEDDKIVRMLLAHPSIDVNKAMNNGSSPLMAACYSGYPEIVRMLLAHPGIDIHQTDNDGRSASDYTQDASILNMLLKPSMNLLTLFLTSLMV